MFEELLSKKLPEIPDDIKATIDKRNSIILTPFADKNELLTNKELMTQAGYGFFDDKGHGLAAMYCPMPGITIEMIQWWFWWHPQADVRYQIWFPGAHKTISFDKKNADYYTQKKMPEFHPSTVNYPKERVGDMTTTCKLQFCAPEDAGFSKKLMEENDIAFILFAHVGIKNLFSHTEMAHIFKKTDDGLFMYSRFWMGESLKNSFLRKKLITDNTLRGMAEHCCIEYRNLVEILPDLYKKYGNG